MRQEHKNEKKKEWKKLKRKYEQRSENRTGKEDNDSLFSHYIPCLEN